MHSLCSAYHWTLDEAFRLTIPQIVMLNHAAYIEHKNAEIRYEHKKTQEEIHGKRAENDPYLAQYGKHLSELEGDALNAYLNDWSEFV